ncbi:Protein cramped-like [Galemys pyrenaicus]|uniref:Protein cramped-like n=1 Tax=Galemys pyrenaicus TaxID=202257 RepID=A0A8J5ZKB6_GALPY|nr:Protein cramped-like [Galemys pyrenaicus]
MTVKLGDGGGGEDGLKKLGKRPADDESLQGEGAGAGDAAEDGGSTKRDAQSPRAGGDPPGAAPPPAGPQDQHHFLRSSVRPQSKRLRKDAAGAGGSGSGSAGPRGKGRRALGRQGRLWEGPAQLGPLWVAAPRKEVRGRRAGWRLGEGDGQRGPLGWPFGLGAPAGAQAPSAGCPAGGAAQGRHCSWTRGCSARARPHRASVGPRCPATDPLSRAGFGDEDASDTEACRGSRWSAGGRLSVPGPVSVSMGPTLAASEGRCRALARPSVLCPARPPRRGPLWGTSLGPALPGRRPGVWGALALLVSAPRQLRARPAGEPSRQLRGPGRPRCAARPPGGRVLVAGAGALAVPVGPSAQHRLWPALAARIRRLPAQRAVRVHPGSLGASASCPIRLGSPGASLDTRGLPGGPVSSVRPCCGLSGLALHPAGALVGGACAAAAWGGQCHPGHSAPPALPREPRQTRWCPHRGRRGRTLVWTWAGAPCCGGGLALLSPGPGAGRRGEGGGQESAPPVGVVERRGQEHFLRGAVRGEWRRRGRVQGPLPPGQRPAAPPQPSPAGPELAASSCAGEPGCGPEVRARTPRDWEAEQAGPRDTLLRASGAGLCRAWGPAPGGGGGGCRPPLRRLGGSARPVWGLGASGPRGAERARLGGRPASCSPGVSRVCTPLWPEARDCPGGLLRAGRGGARPAVSAGLGPLGPPHPGGGQAAAQQLGLEAGAAGSRASAPQGWAAGPGIKALPGLQGACSDSLVARFSRKRCGVRASGEQSRRVRWSPAEGQRETGRPGLGAWRGGTWRSQGCGAAPPGRPLLFSKELRVCASDTPACGLEPVFEPEEAAEGAAPPPWEGRAVPPPPPGPPVPLSACPGHPRAAAWSGWSRVLLLPEPLRLGAGDAVFFGRRPQWRVGQGPPPAPGCSLLVSAVPWALACGSSSPGIPAPTSPFVRARGKLLLLAGHLWARWPVDRGGRVCSAAIRPGGAGSRWDSRLCAAGPVARSAVVGVGRPRSTAVPVARQARVAPPDPAPAFQHGKDFEAIQNNIALKYRKKGKPAGMVKNKEQVRHFYYRTWHKITKYIDFDNVFSRGLKKSSQELYGLICYGELRKKIGGCMDDKNATKLNELIQAGATTVRYKGRNLRIKAPMCRALRKLCDPDGRLGRAGPAGGRTEPGRAVPAALQPWPAGLDALCAAWLTALCPAGLSDEEDQKPVRLPLRVPVELQPRSNHAWARVQGLAQNPRLRMIVELHRKVSSLIEFLRQKWALHEVRVVSFPLEASCGALPWAWGVFPSPGAGAPFRSAAPGRPWRRGPAVLGGRVATCGGPWAAAPCSLTRAQRRTLEERQLQDVCAEPSPEKAVLHLFPGESCTLTPLPGVARVVHSKAFCTVHWQEGGRCKQSSREAHPLPPAQILGIQSGQGTARGQVRCPRGGAEGRGAGRTPASADASQSSGESSPESAPGEGPSPSLGSPDAPDRLGPGPQDAAAGPEIAAAAPTEGGYGPAREPGTVACACSQPPDLEDELSLLDPFPRYLKSCQALVVPARHRCEDARPPGRASPEPRGAEAADLTPPGPPSPSSGPPGLEPQPSPRPPPDTCTKDSAENPGEEPPERCGPPGPAPPPGPSAARLPKDVPAGRLAQQLREEGWSLQTSESLTLAEVYLMMGKPSKLQLEYDWLAVLGPEDRAPGPRAGSPPAAFHKQRLLSCLLRLISTEVNPKPAPEVNTGSAGSTRPAPEEPSTTPPGKVVAISSRSPRCPRSQTALRGSGKSCSPCCTPSSPGSSVVAEAWGGARPPPRGPAPAAHALPPGLGSAPRPLLLAGPTGTGGGDTDGGLFAVPTTLPPNSRHGKLFSPGKDAELALRQHLSSISVQSDFFLPKPRKLRNRHLRKPLVVQRTLLPRPSEGQPHSVCSFSVLPSSSVTGRGSFRPIQSTLTKAALSRPIVPKVLPPQATSHLASAVDLAARSAGIFPGSPLPVLDADSLPAVPPLPSDEATAAVSGRDSGGTCRPAAPLPPVEGTDDPFAGVPAGPDQEPASDGFQDSPVLALPELSRAPAHSGLPTPLPAAEAPRGRLSPPDVSTLLDISLPGPPEDVLPQGPATHISDSIIEIAIGSGQYGEGAPLSPAKLNGGDSSKSLPSPASSPQPDWIASPTHDPQWCPSDPADASLSSLFASLISPEKSRKMLSAPVGANSGTSLLGPSLLDGSSRDSFVSRSLADVAEVVDSQLACMMNENSVDYISRFNDLAQELAVAEPGRRETLFDSGGGGPPIGDLSQ